MVTKLIIKFEPETIIASMEESAYFSDNEFKTKNCQVGNENPTVVKSSSNTILYRISRGGKYFLFKTSANKNSRVDQLLKREFDLSIGLDHPHIAHVYIYDTISSGEEGILMEYIDGKTLDEFISQNPSLAMRESIFSEILETITYLHKKGIIHNDLKPENILISNNDNSVKLIDFGLSDSDAHYLLKTLGCSSLWAAPELFEKRKSDFRSDIYSLGRIMTFLFGTKFSSISRKALKYNPEKRFQNISQLQQAWKNRRQKYKILVYALIVVAIFSLGYSILNYINKSFEKNKIELDQQKANFSHLQKEYSNLQTAYSNLNDSLVNETIKNEQHQKRKLERIENFKRGLKDLFNASYASLIKCKTTEEAGNVIDSFYSKSYDYLKKYDKIVDGEDISVILHSEWTQFQTEEPTKFRDFSISLSEGNIP